MTMAMAMISPSRREVSPAEQLRRSPRLVLPRFRLVAVESRLERWLMIFFLIERLHIAEDEHPRVTRGPTRQNKSRALVELFCRGNFPPGGGNHRHRHHQRSSHREGPNLHQHLHQHHLLSNPSSSLVSNYRL